MRPTSPVVVPPHGRLRALGRLGLVTALTGAVCARGLPAASAAGEGRLRLAHLSPDTPAVDVYVDSVADPAADVTLPGVSYGTVSDYRDVPTGTYTVSMRKAGADPKTPPVLSTTVQVGDGAARTVAGVGRFADLGLRVLQDDLATPPAGQARMRVVAAAAQAGTVDVSLPGGTSVATGLPFAATSGYVDVPAGQTALQVAPAGSAAMLTTNGTPCCSHTCAMAKVCEESKAPTSMCAPSRISFSAWVRATSGRDSVSASMMSTEALMPFMRSAS